MLIDWFTVGAQALNFLILVGLLKHFLYGPILKAIDVREKRVASELADAAAERTQAQSAREDLQNKNKAFDEQRGALLRQATDQAKAERERLLELARKLADEVRTKQDSALRDERTRLGNEIVHLAGAEVFEIARKTLADLATTGLEECLAAVFARRLREMDDQAKGVLAMALKTAKTPAVVRSAFELPPGPKAMIQNAFNESFSSAIPLRFEIAPGVLCGIELTANGQKLAWSISEYLDVLDRKLGALLDARSTPAPVPSPRAQAA